MDARVAAKLIDVPATKFYKISGNPTYVTAYRQEIQVLQGSNGLWSAKFYRGGELPQMLTGSFTSKTECEQRVIQYLKSTDFLNRAIYPGCEH